MNEFMDGFLVACVLICCSTMLYYGLHPYFLKRKEQRKPAYQPTFTAKQFCQLRVENGAFFLYMPDGTKIPDQRDCRVVQTLDQAVMDRPATAEVSITVIATVLDTNLNN